MQLAAIRSASSPFFASALNGINRAMADANRAGEAIAQGGPDLVDSMIGLTQSEILVKLNIITLRTGDEMLGMLLDRKA